MATSPATIKGPIYAKQGVAYRHYFTLPYYDTVGNFSRLHTEVVGSIPIVAGDVKISIDGGALANTTNLPVQLAATSQIYYLDLTAAEMLGERIYVVLVDQTATPVFPDTAFNFVTILRLSQIAIDCAVTTIGFFALADMDPVYLKAHNNGYAVNLVPSGSRSTNLFDTVLGAEPTVIAGTGALAGEAPVSWTSIVNAAWGGGPYLTKFGGTPAWDAGAVSVQQLAGGDGYVSTIADATSGQSMFGLSNGNTNQDYVDIDFAINLTGGTPVVYEGGVSKGTFGTFVTGDKFAVAVESGVVKYKKNGVTFYSSLTAPTYPLLVDTSLLNIVPASQLYSTMVSFGALVIPVGATRSVGSLIQDLWYRIYRKHKKTGSGISGQVLTYKEDGTTAFSTQVTSRPSGSEQIVGKAGG